MLLKCVREVSRGASVFLKGRVLPGFNIETLDTWTEPLCIQRYAPGEREGARERGSDPADRWSSPHQSQNQSDGSLFI